MDAEIVEPVAEAASQGIGKWKHGRLPKAQGGGRAPPAKRKGEEEVCFICFDGGNLVVCDHRRVGFVSRCVVSRVSLMVLLSSSSPNDVLCSRGCSKVYHPPFVNRDDAFFRTVPGLGDLVEATNSIHRMAIHAMNRLVRHPLLEVVDRGRPLIRGTSTFFTFLFPSSSRFPQALASLSIPPLLARFLPMDALGVVGTHFILLYGRITLRSVPKPVCSWIALRSVRAFCGP